MGYEIRLGDLLFPVAPSKVDINKNGNNKSASLINDNDINIIKKIGLVDISFEFLLPNVRYPFAVYEKTVLDNIRGKISSREPKDSFKNSQYFMDKLRDMATSLKPCRLVIKRSLPNGEALYTTSILVAIEDYVIKDDNDNGFDTVISIKLKEYRVYKKQLLEENSVVNSREASASPASSLPKSYVIKSGDTLFGICKANYGDGSNGTIQKVAKANNISNPNLIYAGRTITLPVL